MAETEKQKDIYILGIESSCDETAASVVKNGALWSRIGGSTSGGCI